MIGGYFRRRRFRARTGGGGNWGGYFQLRRNSMIFLGLFLCGLLFGSLSAARDSGGLILAMVTNHIQRQAVSGWGELLSGRLASGLGPVVYLYFAANCVQGRWSRRCWPSTDWGRRGTWPSASSCPVFCSWCC